MKSIVNSEQRNAYLTYLAVCIIWGSTYLAIRIGVSDFPPSLFASFRFISAGTLMLIYSYLKRMTMPKTKTEYIKNSIVGLLMLLGGNGFVTWAETKVSSSEAALLIATVPLFMAMIESLLPKRPRVRLRGWIGLLIGFSGVATLVYPNFQTNSSNTWGTILLILGAFSWALGSIYSKSFKTTASLIPNIAIQMIAGGLGLFLLGAFFNEFSMIHFSINGIGALLYLIFIGSIIGYSSYVYLLQQWPAAKAGTYAYINPIVAVILGTLILGEPFSFRIVISTVIILSGVLLVQTSKS